MSPSRHSPPLGMYVDAIGDTWCGKKDEGECTHICIYVYMCVHMYMYMYVHVHVCACTCTCACVCVHAHCHHEHFLLEWSFRIGDTSQLHVLKWSFSVECLSHPPALRLAEGRSVCRTSSANKEASAPSNTDSVRLSFPAASERRRLMTRNCSVQPAASLLSAKWTLELCSSCLDVMHAKITCCWQSGHLSCVCSALAHTICQAQCVLAASPSTVQCRQPTAL